MKLTDIQRVKKLISWIVYQGLAENERDLAEKLGYTKSSFSQIVNGKVPLSDRFINKLSNFNENINEVWIKTGEGEMLKSGNVTTHGDFSPAAINGNATVEGAAMAQRVKLLEEKIDMLQKMIADKDKIIAAYEKMMNN